MAIGGTHKILDDHEPVATARRAARQSGLTLGAWLDAVMKDALADSRDPERRGPAGRSRVDTGMPVAPAELHASVQQVRARRQPDERRSERQASPQTPANPGSPANVVGFEAAGAGPSAPLSRRPVPNPGGPDRAAPQPGVRPRRTARETVRLLEERLQEIARRVEASQRVPLSQPPAFVPASPTIPDAEVLPASVKSLDEAISEIASRQKALETDFEKTVAERADGVNARMDTLAAQIERAIDEGPPPPPTPPKRERSKPAKSASAPETVVASPAVIDLELMASEIARRIGTVPDRIAEDLTDRLEDAMRRLDTATRSELDAVRAELREIAQDLDRSTRGEFGSLRAEIARLGERIETAPARPDPALETKLEQIAVRMHSANRSEFDKIRTDLRLMADQINRAGPAEIASLRVELARLADLIETSPAHSIASIETKLEDIAGRLATAALGELGAIRHDISDIAEQIERSGRGEFEALRGDLAGLADRMDAAPGAVSATIESRLEDIACRLETAARSEFGEIRKDIGELAGQIDEAGRGGFESMRVELQEIGDRLDRQAADAALHPDVSRLDGIQSELRALAEQIDSMRRDDYGALRRDMEALGERFARVPTNQMAELQANLDVLTERLAGAAQDGDADALAQLETQISRLAENVDAASYQMVSAAELDRAIGDLFSRIQETRSDAVEAARAAAVDAVDRALAAVPGDAAESAILDALHGELAAQRSKAEAADRRSQDMLRSVQETLKTIVGRLEDIGPEALQASASTGADTQPAAEYYSDPYDIAGRIDAVTRKFRSEPEAFADAEAQAPEPPDAPDPYEFDVAFVASDEIVDELVTDDQPVHPEATGSADYVAAARRAAKAAERADDIDLLTGEAKPRRAGLREVLLRFRRPMAIVAIMLVVLYGAVKFAGTLVINPEKTSSLDQPIVVAVVEAPASPAEPDRDADRKPARTKSARADTGKDVRSDPEADRAVAPAKPEAARTAAPAAPLAAVTRVGPLAEVSADAFAPEKLRVAAADGDPVAEYELADRYMNARGMPQDFSKAVEWYQKAAAQGLAPAQYRLASMYEKAQGLDRDLAMALTWYQRAAEQGNSNAMHNLAVLYADGAGGEPDFDRAAMWFRRAADYGLTDSQFNLAVLYARGLGVEVDLGESYRWFAIAADQGDSEASRKRDEVARNLDEATLAKANAEYSVWKPKVPDPGANAVPQPQDGWGDEKPMRQAMAGGALVQTAQSLLTQLGYAPGPADGQIGPRTRDAVRAFQRSADLPETGEITPELLDRLDSSRS